MKLFFEFRYNPTNMNGELPKLDNVHNDFPMAYYLKILVDFQCSPTKMQITSIPGKSLGSEWQCVTECLQLDAMPICMYNLFCHSDAWLLERPPSRVLYICKFTCIIQDLTHNLVIVTWYVFWNCFGISTPITRWILSDRLTQLSDFLSMISIHVRIMNIWWQIIWWDTKYLCLYSYS